MNIGSARSSEVAIQALLAPEDKRIQLQMALLKKNLDAQQEQSAELLKILEGKGQVLDIRV
ncbi:MAG: hypothetical protein WAO58_13210 [Fimbriimonadaceae bacterium]